MKKHVQFKIRSKWCPALLLVMVAVTPPMANVWEITNFTVDDITYAITSPTEVEAVGYIGSATEVGIPETVDDNGEA